MTEADFLWNDAWTVDRDSSAEVLQLVLDHLFVKLRKSLLAGEVPKMRSTDKIMSDLKQHFSSRSAVLSSIKMIVKFFDSLPPDDYTAFNYLDVFALIFHPDGFGSVSNLSSSATFNTQHWLFSFDVELIKLTDPTQDKATGIMDDLLICCTIESEHHKSKFGAKRRDMARGSFLNRFVSFIKSRVSAPAPASVPAPSQPPVSTGVDVLSGVVSGLEHESSNRLALASNASLTWQEKHHKLPPHLVPTDSVVATVMRQMTLKSHLADGSEVHRFGVFQPLRLGDCSAKTASSVVSESRTTNLSKSKTGTEQFVADARSRLVIQSASQSKQQIPFSEFEPSLDRMSYAYQFPGAASDNALNRHTMHIRSLLHTEFPEPECVGFIIDYEFALRQVWGNRTSLGDSLDEAIHFALDYHASDLEKTYITSKLDAQIRRSYFGSRKRTFTVASPPAANAIEAPPGAPPGKGQDSAKGKGKAKQAKPADLPVLEHKPKFCYDFHYNGKCEDTCPRGFSHLCPLKLPDGTVCKQGHRFCDAHPAEKQKLDARRNS